jgi:hypothetical protein
MDIYDKREYKRLCQKMSWCDFCSEKCLQMRQFSLEKVNDGILTYFEKIRLSTPFKKKIGRNSLSKTPNKYKEQDKNKIFCFSDALFHKLGTLFFSVLSTFQRHSKSNTSNTQLQQSF